MARADKLNLNKDVNKEINVQCPRCVGPTAHKILANANLSGGDGHMDWQTDYQILQCMGCKTISYRSESSNSEDFDHYTDEDGEEELVYTTTEKLYPPRIYGYSGLGEDRWLLPDTLRRIYDETSSALIADQPVLTGIGVRAILETLCKDKAAKGNNLLKQIDDLVSLGILTPGRASVLHQIRTLGNLSAHEAAPHTPAQLGLAMAVVDHLLEEVYILPEKTQRLFSGLAPIAISSPSPIVTSSPLSPAIPNSVPVLPAVTVSSVPPAPPAP
ncbi:hypothetical protein Rfer_2839 [Rhodoferax ferrireducens T118]|uniref:DUF4145 domain-containing protein n=1 Tax=Albidiferax ferrireducens (strain ATCC BAA-621 / DSM 15236 / T118) TaxID=338969 RepID=Q21UK2_ALBFT|nr:DUF4145 domain-containing protein [Rhodoferax ferrireducens]ABD70551.1 hypothetical protein Rfer_2839 [Rhodoferax ferrireducens T118]